MAERRHAAGGRPPAVVRPGRHGGRPDRRAAGRRAGGGRPGGRGGERSPHRPGLAGARRRRLRGGPRPGRPPHPPPPARAGGGRDGRDRDPGGRRWAGSPRWWPCPTPSRPSTRPRRSATSSTWPPRPRPRWRWPGPSPWAGPASGWPRWPSWPRSGVRLFTDDGAGVQSAGLMRRALEYATGLGVTLAQHCEDATLAADGAMHEGAWSSRLGLPGHAGVGRGGHGGPGPGPGPGHRRPGSTSSTCRRPARSSWCAGPRPRGWPSPPRPPPTTSP